MSAVPPLDNCFHSASTSSFFLQATRNDTAGLNLKPSLVKNSTVFQVVDRQVDEDLPVTAYSHHYLNSSDWYKHIQNLGYVVYSVVFAMPYNATENEPPADPNIGEILLRRITNPKI
jgi:hypothetical protein